MHNPDELKNNDIYEELKTEYNLFNEQITINKELSQSIVEELNNIITYEFFPEGKNANIAKRLYEEFEKGNSNINGIIDSLEQEEQNQITMIMADDYEIDDLEKAIDDIIQIYRKERLNNKKFEILEKLENATDEEEKKILMQELSNIITTLAKIK